MMKHIIGLSCIIFFLTSIISANNEFGIITKIENNKVYINLAKTEGINKDVEFNIYRKVKVDNNWVEKKIAKAWVIDIQPEVCVAYCPQFEQLGKIKVGDRAKIVRRMVKDAQIPLPDANGKVIEAGQKVRSFVITKEEVSSQPIMVTSRADSNKYIIGKVIEVKNNMMLLDMLPIIEKGKMIKIVRPASTVIHPATKKPVKVGQNLVFVGTVSAFTQQGIKVTIMEGKKNLDKLNYQDEVMVYEME